MYIPKKLELTNFGSHENTVIEFPEHLTTLIQGFNESNDGQKSNGSGKSFVIEGLSFALLGSSLRKVKDKELVMDGEKSANISFYLSNPATKETLTIHRKIYSNTKSGELKVEENDQLTSVNEGNQYILDTLGLTRDDILNYYLLSKERYVSFFSSSDTSKKELINRFSKANKVDVAIDDVNYDIGDRESNALKITNAKAKTEASIEGLSETVTDNSGIISSLVKDCEEGLKKIEELKGSINDSKTKAKNLDQELNVLTETIDKNKPKLKEIDDLIKEYQAKEDELERHFNNEVECPKCSHHFSLKDDKFSLEEAKKIYPQIKEAISDLVTERKLIEDELNDYKKSFEFVKNDSHEVNFQIKRSENEIKSINSSIQSSMKQIEKLKEVTNNSDKIKKLKETLKKLDLDLYEANKELQISSEWLLRFKRFKGWLANQSLSSIQSYANFYLSQLNSDLQIQIDGYTPVKNGKEIREKISTTVFRNGVEASFNRFSGGEKARIEVALILSMQHIINESTNGLGLDMIVLDEVLDSCDSLGIELICKALNKLKKNVLIITQIDINMNYENILVVKKVGGVSQIN